MNLTQKIKQKKTFSLADFLIILVIIASALGLLFRSGLVKKLLDQTESEELSVRFCAESITEASASVFVENALFYDGNEIFGKLVSANIEPATGYYENEHGELSEYEISGHADVYGNFLCNLTPSEKGYLLRGQIYIAPGSTFVIKSEGRSAKITVLSIGK